MSSSTPSSVFGKRLQALRRDLQLTQIDLSNISQLSKSYISFLESGVRHPSRDAVLRLAEALSPGDARLRDELLVLAGFTPAESSSLLAAMPAYSREDFRSFLQHTLQLIRQQEFSRAEKEIESGFQRFKRPAQMQTLLAHLELARGAFEQAILFQKTALQHYDLSPAEQDKGLTLVDFILNLGVMYFLWGDQAMFASQQADSEATSLRRQAIGRYQLALENFERGLEQVPAHLYLLDEAGRVHFNLADLCEASEADRHWDACITCFRQVLAHPDKYLLPLLTLRESAAFLALAYARRGDFHSSQLLLDTLSLDPGNPWTVAYIHACCASLAYGRESRPELLEQAILALERAVRLDPVAVKAQFGLDGKDFAPLLAQNPEALEKVINFD
ncbi:MAG: helix-turn-helix domain-containing protein [Candidatus Sericytochromatia bacterium]